MEKYVWEGSPSQKTLAEILGQMVNTADATRPNYLQPLEGSLVSIENIGVVQPVQHYRAATTVLHNQGMFWWNLNNLLPQYLNNLRLLIFSGENEEIVEDYGRAVRTLFNLPQRT